MSPRENELQCKVLGVILLRAELCLVVYADQVSRSFQSLNLSLIFWREVTYKSKIYVQGVH